MRALPVSEARRIRNLAAGLALVLGGAALYAEGLTAPKRFLSYPSDSHGSPTLDVAVAAASPAARENTSTGAPVRRLAETSIAWTRPWGNKS